MEKYIEKATFSEIHKLLKSRENKELLKCFTNLFKVGLIFLPGLFFPEEALMDNIGNGINILEAGQLISNVVNNIHKYFKNRKYKDYKTRYEDMQIAHFLITYAAFFDTIKEYLPNESKKIDLKSNEKLFITKEAITKYKTRLKTNDNSNSDHSWMDFEIVLPTPLCSYNTYIDKLKEFYQSYSNEFFDFYTKLECWESLTEENKDQVMAIIKNLPQKSIENYKKQYFELACCFKDFEIWSNQYERSGIKHEIDVGFKKIDKSLSKMIENSKNKTIVDILNKQSNFYFDYISQSIIKGETESLSTNQLCFPLKSEIFVPQQFKALRYIDNMKLEPEETWTDINKQDNIGEFIGSMLHHPDCNTRPLIILGLPGAGKSLLCNMLAAKLLYQEYHVIIVTLRDSKADDTIQQQIVDQIKRELGANCSWYDISSAKLDKPLLIIFDGYDELLQSSGKTYSKYINDIADFQRAQLITSNLQVKCIITSRTILIDKAYIPNGTTILRLCDFDEKRINEWINIWNSYNLEYFKKNKLKKFSLPNNDKIFELAKQPLLLMMLALYDSIDNKLDKEKNLTQTQLYNNLINDFVLREKKKNKEFDELCPKEQNNELDEEIKKIGIIAIGMYNRNRYHIVSNDLNSDIIYYKNVCSLINTNSFVEDDSLSESEKLLGSFFFMYKSLSTEYENKNKKENAAYEFLHNTFGEFLTAHFIFSNLYDSIDEVLFSLEHNRQINWENVLTNQWYTSLMYVPLFIKPVVISMLKEWSSITFSKNNIDKRNIKFVLDKIINLELEKIIAGEIYIILNNIINKRENAYPSNDLLYHVSTYSINLIMLRSILTDVDTSIELTKLDSTETIKKLAQMWKYAFRNDDLLKFSHLFLIKEQDNSISIKYNYKNIETEYRKDDKLEMLYDISVAIGDKQMQSLSGCLIGNYDYKDNVLESISKSGLDLNKKYSIFSVINNISNFESSYELFQPLYDLIYLKKEKDNFSNNIICCLTLLKLIIEHHKKNRYYYKEIYNQVVLILKELATVIFTKKSRFINRKYYSGLLNQFYDILYNEMIDDRDFLMITKEFKIFDIIARYGFNSYWGIKCINRFIEISKFKHYLVSNIFEEYTLDLINNIIHNEFDDYHFRDRDHYMDYNDYNNYKDTILVLNETMKLSINWLSNNKDISEFKHKFDLFRDFFRTPLVHHIIENNKKLEFKNDQLIIEFLSNYIILLSYYRKMNYDYTMNSINEYIDVLNDNPFVLLKLYNFSEDSVFKLLYILNEGFFGVPIAQQSIKKLIKGNKEAISNRVLKQLREYCIKNNYLSIIPTIEKYFEF